MYGYVGIICFKKDVNICSCCSKILHRCDEINSFPGIESRVIVPPRIVDPISIEMYKGDWRDKIEGDVISGDLRYFCCSSAVVVFCIEGYFELLHVVGIDSSKIC